MSYLSWCASSCSYSDVLVGIFCFLVIIIFFVNLNLARTIISKEFSSKSNKFIRFIVSFILGVVASFLLFLITGSITDLLRDFLIDIMGFSETLNSEFYELYGSFSSSYCKASNVSQLLNISIYLSINSIFYSILLFLSKLKKSKKIIIFIISWLLIIVLTIILLYFILKYEDVAHHACRLLFSVK